MNNIKQTRFNYIGNLAFYDGWKPNYIYFKSLLAAGETYSDSANNRWRTDLALPIANRAIADATSHSHLNGLSEENASIAMLERFNNICTFLQNAITYERNNEVSYFKQKYEQLKNTFTAEEQKTIPQLAELFEMFNPDNTKEFDYTKFIALINVLQHGLDQTKVIANYEQQHLSKIDNAIKEVVQARDSQITGLGTKQKKSLKEIQEMVEKSHQKIENELTIEYLKHGSFGNRDASGKYYSNVRGVKAHFDFKKFHNSIDVELAHWITNTLKDIIQDGELVDRLASVLQSEYPVDGNFDNLSGEVKAKIIDAVQSYGINNLAQALKTRVTSKYAKEIAENIANNPDIYNTQSAYNIKGYFDNYGQYGKILELFKDVDQISDLKEKSATGLYDAINELIKNLHSKKWLPSQDQTQLQQVFANNKQWAGIEEIVSFIHKIEKMQKELNRIQEQYDKGILKLDEISGKTLSSGNKDKNHIEVQLEVIDDKVTIRANEKGKSSLGSAISSTSAFKRFGLQSFNPSDLKGAISSLKKAASQSLRSKLIQSLEAAMQSDKFGLSEEELLKSTAQGLQNLKISIGGPKLSEITAGLNFRQRGNDLIVDWTGSNNGKNDVVSIAIDVNNIKTHIDVLFNDKLEGVITSVTKDDIMSAREQYLTAVNDAFDNAVKKNAAKNVDKYTIQGKIFQDQDDEKDQQVTNAMQQLQTLWEKIDKDLSKRNISEKDKNDLRKQFFSVLNDSFYVSTTVKTYNEYNNQIGYLGGSLGGDLESQLNRIAELFMSAGDKMSNIKNDMDWLRFAIINCTPGSILGTSNKGLIESYLGSVAALALFDEGGAEGEVIQTFSEQLKNGVNEAVNQTGSMKILHLYKGNGIYVPGSYILEQVLKSLQEEVIPNILDIPTTMKHGAGITIINNVSEQSTAIPNRPIFNRTSWNSNAWAVAGASAEGQVKLQILFLAGLLDIVNSINATLRGVEMPG